MPKRPVEPRHSTDLGPQPDPRQSASFRGYDRHWRKLAVAFLAEHPLCKMCDANGLTVAATLVDHVEPINDGGRRLDKANLQSLCRRCHQIKTESDIAKRKRKEA